MLWLEKTVNPFRDDQGMRLVEDSCNQSTLKHHEYSDPHWHAKMQKSHGLGDGQRPSPLTQMPSLASEHARAQLHLLIREIAIDCNLSAQGAVLAQLLFRNTYPSHISAKTLVDNPKCAARCISACIFLAAKASEASVRLRDIINAVEFMLQVFKKAPTAVAVAADDGGCLQSILAPVQSSHKGAYTSWCGMDMNTKTLYDECLSMYRDHEHIGLKAYWNLRKECLLEEQRVMQAMGFNIPQMNIYDDVVHCMLFIHPTKYETCIAWGLTNDIHSASLVDFFPTYILAAAICVCAHKLAHRFLKGKMYQNGVREVDSKKKDCDCKKCEITCVACGACCSEVEGTAGFVLRRLSPLLLGRRVYESDFLSDTSEADPLAARGKDEYQGDTDLHSLPSNLQKQKNDFHALDDSDCYTQTKRYEKDVPICAQIAEACRQILMFYPLTIKGPVVAVKTAI